MGCQKLIIDLLITKTKIKQTKPRHMLHWIENFAVYKNEIG